MDEDGYMDEDDYVRLSAHLASIDPVLERFCVEESFEVQTTGLGRYPRRRVNRFGEVNRYIEIQMDLDEHDEEYQVFFESIPYSVAAGLWKDFGDVRYGHSFWHVRRLPFSKIVENARLYIDDAYAVLLTWNLERLMKEGRMGKLDVNAPDEER